MKRTYYCLFLLPILAPALQGCPTDAGIGRRPVAPSVTITAPTDGSFFAPTEGPLALGGLVSDNRDAAEDLSARWSVDGSQEQAASVQADENVTGELTLDELDLGGHDLSLEVEDGDGEVAEDHVRFYLATVSISSPADGSLFYQDDEITFQGATDLGGDEDNLLAGLSFEWSSSLDDALDGAVSGEGASILVASELSAGVHTITLTVASGSEAAPVGSASIDVTVQPEIVEAEPGDLIFSEFMVDPQIVEDWYGEWVELWNASDFAIDIEGYSFHDDDIDAWTLTGSIVVQPRAYVVLCASPSEPPQSNSATNGGVPCDGVFYRPQQGSGGGIALANGTDEVALSRPDGTLIDLLNYDGNWYTQGVAIGVDPNYLTADDNDDLSRWCNQNSIVSSGGEPGTPGQENDSCPDPTAPNR